MSKIGFIGVGHIGGPMARNLLRAGHGVAVCDPSAENVASLTAALRLVADTQPSRQHLLAPTRVEGRRIQADAGLQRNPRTGA